MPNRTPIVGGNWKMNLDLASACELADDVMAGCGEMPQTCDVAVFPPFPYLHTVGRTLAHSGVLLGAQDVYPEGPGAFTGEVCTEMLTDLNVAMVIIGHSERRHVIGETDEQVNAKTRVALAADLTITLCVGETIEQREAESAQAVVTGQLRDALRDIDVDDLARVVIAYEPVWAIGTGRTATPDQAQDVHRLIRAMIEGRDATIAAGLAILYGGSVKGANAGELLAMEDIDGGLVGGASLEVQEFLAIFQAAA